MYRLKGYEIPEAGRTARGVAIVNLLQLQPDEKITAVITKKEYGQGEYLFMATRSGMVKKTSLDEYSNIRKTGLAAITLKEDDELIAVKTTDDTKDIFLVSKLGQCIRFHETDVRPTGRNAMGVKGMTLAGEDEVIGMQLDTQGDALLTVTEHGMGKRTLMSEFASQYRGGKGVICHKVSEKTGALAGVKAVDPEHEVMIITTEGVIIRIKVGDISVIGRNTSGVILMNVNGDIRVASVAKVRESEKNDAEEEIEDGEASDVSEVTVSDADPTDHIEE